MQFMVLSICTKQGLGGCATSKRCKFTFARCLSELQIFWHELNCPRNGRERKSWGNAPEIEKRQMIGSEECAGFSAAFQFLRNTGT